MIGRKEHEGCSERINLLETTDDLGFDLGLTGRGDGARGDDVQDEGTLVRTQDEGSNTETCQSLTLSLCCSQ